MPFALHTMDPGCPVVAIADDPSAAWEAADRMGLPRAKALVMPCAMTLPQAARATDETHRARMSLLDARAERDAMRETRDRAIADVETIRKRTPDRVIAEMERIRDELSRGLDALRADIAATRPDDASKSTEAA